MKSMLKSELAQAAGVSYGTFNKWFKEMIPTIEHDLNLTFNPQNRLIPPNVVKWICEKYCIEI